MFVTPSAEYGLHAFPGEFRRCVFEASHVEAAMVHSASLFLQEVNRPTGATIVDLSSRPPGSGASVTDEPIVRHSASSDLTILTIHCVDRDIDQDADCCGDQTTVVNILARKETYIEILASSARIDTHTANCPRLCWQAESVLLGRSGEVWPGCVFNCRMRGRYSSVLG